MKWSPHINFHKDAVFDAKIALRHVADLKCEKFQKMSFNLYKTFSEIGDDDADNRHISFEDLIDTIKRESDAIKMQDENPDTIFHIIPSHIDESMHHREIVGRKLCLKISIDWRGDIFAEFEKRGFR